MAKKYRKRPMSEINVVPYIDVMLVLLVIFMITTPLLTRGVKVDLPQASAKPVPPSKKTPVIVSVDAKGQYYFQRKGRAVAVDAETLVARVAAALKLYPGSEVLVKGDRKVAYEKVVNVMALLQRKAGVPSVGLITEDPDSKR
jgi:biopolymer transport protein TolR